MLKMESESENGNGEEIAIIREIYNGKNAHENFEMELERALDQQCQTIVIEPMKLGEETVRWISMGNCLHKTAVLSGFGSLACSFIWPDRPYIAWLSGASAVFCSGLYTISWQFDPCCKYQVQEHDSSKLSSLQLTSSSSPVLLVRTDDSRKNVFHWTVTLAALTLCGFRLYQRYA